MKYLLLLLTSCLPFGVAALLAHQPAGIIASGPAISRERELKELETQRQEICRRMDILHAERRNFLPR